MNPLSVASLSSKGLLPFLIGSLPSDPSPSFVMVACFAAIGLIAYQAVKSKITIMQAWIAIGSVGALIGLDLVYWFTR